MQIKKFEAKNMTTALRMIKDEFGMDAVILSARSLRKGKGFFGSMKYAGVEVTAAIDNQRTPMKTADSAGGMDSYSSLGKTRFTDAYRAEKKDSIPAAGNPKKSLSHRTRYNRRKKAGSNGTNRILSSLYQEILAQEVDRGIASELIEEIKRVPASQELLTNGDLRSHLALILEEMGLAVGRNTFAKRNPSMAAFIGTSGVGKTTTIAKLAALQVNRHRRQVALITLDNYGIAATEQLKAYAQIIGIPLEAAVNTTELKRAVKKFRDKELILIDTPGINPKNKDQVRELKTYFAKMTDLQTHLVLSATTKEKDLIAITEAFKAMDVHRLLFTRIDESSVFGNIVNILIRTSIPLSFLCGGRKVPDDIETGSILKLVDLLFQSKSANGQQPTVSSNSTAVRSTDGKDQHVNRLYFVANRNTDVYHCTNCKWSKTIKPENIIKFSGAQEAEAQNFLPCRSCNPDRFTSGNPIDSKTEKMKFSSYR